MEFSQGDYNVELVIALNVADSSHLDQALSAHGKILHDAVVSTVTTQQTKSTLGTIDWHGTNVSGVSEMLVELIDEIKTPQAPMGESTATALLTGIIAVTERFSNALTSSRVMTLAAELMAAGANQQQIITKLAESQRAAQEADTATDAEDTDDSASKAARAKKNKKSNDGSLTIRHEKTGSLDEVAQQALAEQQDEAARAAQSRLDRLNKAQAPPTPTKSPSGPQTASKPQTKPLIGGTLNATTERAERDKRRELDDDRNKTILSHSSHMDNEPRFGDKPLNAAMADSDEPPKVDPLAKANPTNAGSADTKKVIMPLGQTPPPAKNTDVRSALAEVTQAINSVPPTPSDPVANALQFEPLTAPVGRGGAKGPGPNANPANNKTLAELEVGTTHDTSAVSAAPAPQSSLPMPDFSSLPPLPPAPSGLDISELPPLPEVPDKEFNPAKFQIPGKTD